jgi:hypothetical protein
MPLLEAITRRLGSIESKLGISGEVEGDALPPYVKEYEDLLGKYKATLEDAAKGVGEDVVKMVSGCTWSSAQPVARICDG